jgi:hypothetical protein
MEGKINLYSGDKTVRLMAINDIFSWKFKLHAAFMIVMITVKEKKKRFHCLRY